MKTSRGYTLVEVLVAVSIIGILAAIIVPNINAGSAQARDAERQAKVREVQVALERYYREYGRYPDGCNTGTDWDGIWSGQPGSGAPYECTSGSAEYIDGLAPEFIPRLPIDQNLPGNDPNEGYVYITNPDGAVYKFMALNTVESETVESGGSDPHPLARCGSLTFGSISECAEVPVGPLAGGAYNSSGGLPSSCDSPEIDNDYAVVGGYARSGSDDFGSTFLSDDDGPRVLEFFSDAIRCK